MEETVTAVGYSELIRYQKNGSLNTNRSASWSKLVVTEFLFSLYTRYIGTGSTDVSNRKISKLSPYRVFSLLFCKRFSQRRANTTDNPRSLIFFCWPGYDSCPRARSENNGCGYAWITIRYNNSNHNNNNDNNDYNDENNLFIHYIARSPLVPNALSLKIFLNCTNKTKMKNTI